MKGTYIEFEVFGPLALFSTPLSSMSGNKTSYAVPTYSALKGLLENIYWKPTIKYYIDSVRIINPIRYETITVNNIKSSSTSPELAEQGYKGANAIQVQIPTPIVYLKDVRYQVRAYFVFNEDRPDLAEDRNAGKHGALIERSLKRGGRFPTRLGASECVAYVKPCVFGEGESVYDNIPETDFGVTLHSIQYDANGVPEYAIYDNYKMESGVIKFKRPEDCSMKSAINRKK